MKNSAKDKLFSVYVHIAPNGKRYYGITSREPHRRWGNGNGYRQNRHFYNAIKHMVGQIFNMTLLQKRCL